MVGKTQTQKVELSIIIVSYNSQRLHETLASIIKNIQRISYEIILVENNAEQNQIHRLKREYPLIKAILNPSNVGFAQANNQALKYAQGMFVIFLNPDIIIEKTTITLLLQRLKEDQRIGMIAPQLLNENGGIQYSCRRFPTVRAWLSRILNIETEALRRYEMREFDHQNERDVDWCSAAFLMIRKEVLMRVGFFDENIFMYLEDADLCRRVKQYYQVIYYPLAKALHYASYGSRKKLRLFFYHLKSGIYYFLKWGIFHG